MHKCRSCVSSHGGQDLNSGRPYGIWSFMQSPYHCALEPTPHEFLLSMFCVQRSLSWFPGIAMKSQLQRVGPMALLSVQGPRSAAAHLPQV